MKTFFVLSCSILSMIAFGCSSLTLSPVHYQWPIESVLTVGRKGTSKRLATSSHSMSTLLFEETGDSVQHVSGVESALFATWTATTL